MFEMQVDGHSPRLTRLRSDPHPVRIGESGIFSNTGKKIKRNFIKNSAAGRVWILVSALLELLRVSCSI